MTNFTRKDVAHVLQSLGLPKGAVTFSHSNLAYFGVPKRGASREAYKETVLDPILEALGPEGTYVVPTFTYSFTKREIFDPDNTPSVCGVLTEIVRLHPQAFRSEDPIFSVAAIGKRAEELTANVSRECFGIDSFWDRFFHADGIILGLNFGVPTTFFHYVERCLNVPYRYNKLFPGTFHKRGKSYRGAAIYFCRDMMNYATDANWMGIEALANERGLTRSAPVGRGFISLTRARDLYDLIFETLKKQPFFLTNSRSCTTPPPLVWPSLEVTPELPAQASLMEIIKALWHLPRDIVSAGYDAALNALTHQVPMTIHEYATGTECWTWIIPEKWTCHEAYLETLGGKRLFSYADNPLHVISYSLPFEGEVSREELFDHLHVHPKIPEAIPFKFKYYERDWGLCCSENLKASLTDDRYRVVIKTSFSYGTLKVGEVVVPGESEENIVLCAHLCHPAMVNDDLTGVVVGLEVMRELLKRHNLHYTYRFLIVPETIGSVAYLSHNEELIPRMKGGVFLETLGLDNSHALQLSFDGNTELDLCFALTMREYDPDSWTGPFRRIIGNDERQFNAPGVRVPMLSLSRVLPPSAPDWPYREYHSSHDTPELVSIRSLEDSRDLVLRMIDTLENNLVPVNKFKGEVFCSRYGLHIDFYTNPEGNRALLDIMYLIDGTRSVAEIARACGISFWAAKKTIDELHRHGLVEYMH